MHFYLQNFVDFTRSLRFRLTVWNTLVVLLTVIVALFAVRKGLEHWATSFDVHSSAVEGPWCFKDQFAVRFTIDATMKSTGERTPMDEIGVYTVKDGKIVHERFYY